MKILLQSTLFAPSVGGVETVSQCLAQQYAALGHSCTVLTRSPGNGSMPAHYQVVRNASLKDKLALIKSHDVVHANGASIELVFWAKMLGTPIVWTHQSYLLQAIDGLGWVEGEEAPLAPMASIVYHGNRFGWKWAIKEGLKLYLKRSASYLVSKNVAITNWVAKRQPLPNQIIIYNPFPIYNFATTKQTNEHQYDFFFLGRLVSEKGVTTLIKAFHALLLEMPNYSKNLLLIGDGNWRKVLEDLALELGIAHRIEFAGRQTGEELLRWVEKGKIAIIPSEWEEPMGGVALEMLAAGKAVIVSQKGGLLECIGDCGLSFPNQDHVTLAKQMRLLLQNDQLREQFKEQTKAQLAKFDEQLLASHYIALFESLLGK